MSNTIHTVYVDGVFDMCHYGHIKYLKRVKTMGQRLVVGVVTDDDARSYKRRPVIPFDFRMKTIQELGIADDVIPAQLVITKEYLEKHGITTVVHGDDDQQVGFFKVPIELGMMKYIPYTSGISTTDIIQWCKERG